MTDQTMETVNQQQETVTKQKNPLRIEQGKRLKKGRKKEELKHLNKQITKQDDMVEHKPIKLSNNYLTRPLGRVKSRNARSFWSKVC